MYVVVSTSSFSNSWGIEFIIGDNKHSADENLRTVLMREMREGNYCTVQRVFDLDKLPQDVYSDYADNPVQVVGYEWIAVLRLRYNR